jgi:hypothetical protein
MISASRAGSMMILFHLCLHVFGALGSPGITKLGPFQFVLATYGHLSGSVTEYGFFAPRPGAPMKASVAVVMDDGTVVNQPVEMSNSETQHRMNCLVGAVRNETTTEKHQILAASIAAHFFDENPRAAQVVVTYQALAIPSLHDAVASGSKAQWASIGSYAIGRQDSSLYAHQD